MGENMVYRRNLTRYMALTIAVVGSMVLFGIFSGDPYTVETTVTYLYGNSNPDDPPALSLDEEIRILGSQEIVSGLARNLFHPAMGFSVSRQQLPFFGQASMKDVLSHVSNNRWKFEDTNQFFEWFSEKLATSPNSSKRASEVTLSLSGDDPDFLKLLLKSHVRLYAEYRRALETRRRTDFRQIAVNRRPACAPERVLSLDRQLEKFEIQERGCQLALKLLAGNRGVFSGFVPGASLVGIPAVARFQEKIVDLEIEKRALAVKFTPKSPEIRKVGMQIRGIKTAMKECLVEHVRYLKTGRQELADLKERFRSNQGPVAKTSGLSGGRSSGQLPNGGRWFLIRDGLYMLHDKPVVEEHPLLVKAEACKKTLLAYLYSSPSSRTYAGRRKNSGVARIACSLGTEELQGAPQSVGHPQPRVEKTQLNVGSSDVKSHSPRNEGTSQFGSPSPHKDSEPTIARQKAK